MVNLRNPLDWFTVEMVQKIATIIVTALTCFSAYIFYDWFSIEKVKTIAAVIQAFGFVVAAFLTYRYAIKLEGQKFEMKLREIKHAGTHTRRLDRLEKICELMEKLLFDMRKIAPDLCAIPSIEMQEGEDLNQFRAREFSYRTKDFGEANLQLLHAYEGSSMYLTKPLKMKLDKFRKTLHGVVENHAWQLMEERFISPPPSPPLTRQFVDVWNQKCRERDEIISEIQVLIGA